VRRRIGGRLSSGASPSAGASPASASAAAASAPTASSGQRRADGDGLALGDQLLGQHPSAGATISVSTLSVAIRADRLLGLHLLADRFSHSITVPSSTETPMCGIGTITVARFALTGPTPLTLRPRPGP